MRSPREETQEVILMLCSFTNQVLAQHDLSRYWKETKACKADVVSETDVFVSSTGNFNISASDLMKNLRNVSLVGNSGHFVEIDFAGSEGLEGMKVGNIKPQVDPFVFPFRRGVNVFSSGRLLNFGLRHWPSFLLDVVFLHETGAGAVLLRFWKETTACKNAQGWRRRKIPRSSSSSVG